MNITSEPENTSGNAGFVAKLQSLPENKKKIIFFMVMAVAVLGAIIFMLFTVPKNIAKFGQSLESINSAADTIKNQIAVPTESFETAQDREKTETPVESAPAQEDSDSTESISEDFNAAADDSSLESEETSLEAEVNN